MNFNSRNLETMPILLENGIMRQIYAKKVYLAIYYWIENKQLRINVALATEILPVTKFSKKFKKFLDTRRIGVV